MSFIIPIFPDQALRTEDDYCPLCKSKRIQQFAIDSDANVTLTCKQCNWIWDVQFERFNPMEEECQK